MISRLNWEGQLIISNVVVVLNHVIVGLGQWHLLHCRLNWFFIFIFIFLVEKTHLIEEVSNPLKSQWIPPFHRWGHGATATKSDFGDFPCNLYLPVWIIEEGLSAILLFTILSTKYDFKETYKSCPARFPKLLKKSRCIWKLIIYALRSFNPF